MSGGFLSLRITFAYALAEEGDRRAVAEETAVPACCAFLEGGGASLQPCSVPSSCIPVDSVVMRP